MGGGVRGVRPRLIKLVLEVLIHARVFRHGFRHSYLRNNIHYPIPQPCDPSLVYHNWIYFIGIDEV